MIRTFCCPANADDFSDEYVLGRISPEAAAEFEAHAMACADCASLIEDSRTVVQVMRLSAELKLIDLTGVLHSVSSHGAPDGHSRDVH
jgi:anti-sigma factor RsiW